MTTIRNILNQAFVTQIMSVALAAVVTLAMLGGVDHLATVEQGAQGALLVQQQVAPRA